MIEMNTYHLTHIKADFLKNTGKRVAFLSKLPITYKSSKYARESFNADTVITYPLKMWEKYENKYIICLWDRIYYFDIIFRISIPKHLL